MLLPITLAPAVDPSPSPPCQSLAAICQRAKSKEQRQIERWEWLSETAPMPLSGCPAFPRRPLYAPLPVSLAASLYASLCTHAFCRTNEPQVPLPALVTPLCFGRFHVCSLGSHESHPRCSGPSLRRPPGDVQYGSSQGGGDGTSRQPPPSFCTPGIRQAARGRHQAFLWDLHDPPFSSHPRH